MDARESGVANAKAIAKAQEVAEGQLRQISEANRSLKETNAATLQSYEKALQESKRNTEQLGRVASTFASGVVEMRRANRDAMRARIVFFDSSVTDEAQIEEPRQTRVVLANIGSTLSPWYVIEKACLSYVSSIPTTTPCPAITRGLPGRKIVPMSWEASPISGLSETGEEIAPLPIMALSPGVLSSYLAGNTNAYWFVAIRYADGMGGIRRAEGCWYLTKRDPDLGTIGSVGQHFILPCPGFPRERSLSGVP